MPMAYQSKPNLSMVYALLAMALICILSLLGPRVIRPAFEDLARGAALAGYQAAFEQIQHPAGTARLALRSAVVLPAGSGQGCDFFVGELRTTSVRLEGILEAYAGQAAGGTPLQVALLEDGHIPASLGALLPPPLGDLPGWELPAPSRLPDYLVYLLVLGEESPYGCR